jgi:hypothetical protein
VAEFQGKVTKVMHSPSGSPSPPEDPNAPANPPPTTPSGSMPEVPESAATPTTHIARSIAGSRMALEAITRRMSSECLGQAGIKSFRILDETRLKQALERTVENRVKERIEEEARIAPPGVRMAPAELRALREDYRERWQRFRRRFEGKLRVLEELATKHGSSSPRRG